MAAYPVGTSLKTRVLTQEGGVEIATEAGGFKRASAASTSAWTAAWIFSAIALAPSSSSDDIELQQMTATTFE